MAKLSIIVPVYNSANYLVRCLDSILAQTFRDFELLVVNDGSTDRSPQICDSYAEKDQRIKVIHKSNGGSSSARNRALEIMEGEYVGFIDSDDWISKDMFEHLIHILESTNSDIANIKCISTYTYSFIPPSNSTIQIYEGEKILESFFKEGAGSGVGSYSFCRNLYKREIMENLRFPEGQTCEDIVLSYKALTKAKRIVKSEKIAYYYFISHNSNSMGGLKASYIDMFEAYKQFKELTQNSNPIIKRMVRIINARADFSLLAKIARYGIADDSLNKKQIIYKHIRLLRKNYFLLLSSSMPFNRKLMMTLLCLNYHCLALPLSFYKILFTENK